MKTTRPHRSRPGFTLVELLVVIAIIAVLAAMGFAGAQAAINRARKTKARKVCVTMDQAVMSFYDEYGFLPTNPDGDTTLDTDSDEDNLLTILLGYEAESSKMQNQKKIRFFEAGEAKGGKTNPKDGIRYGSSNSVEGLYDPWGETYQVLLDGDYDETLDNPFSSGSGSNILRGRRVATFSYGKNGKNDDGGGDDVKSW
jgi:prepilin-type N-terminal cleavage/methylation domain-containing protein